MPLCITQTGTMTPRRAHRITILRDLDVLHALGVAGAALVLTGGLLYLVYLGNAWKVARTTSAEPDASQPGGHVLVLGKHCPDGVPDADYLVRLERARALAWADASRELMLLGGGPAPTEAEIGARELRRRGLPHGLSLVLEDESRDTMENLRHARRLLALRPSAPVILISNRYHLARCALFARNLGIPHRLCAAEPAWRVSPRALAQLLREAAYLMWVDVGARWARLIGHRRMLAKLS